MRTRTLLVTLLVAVLFTSACGLWGSDAEPAAGTPLSAEQVGGDAKPTSLPKDALTDTDCRPDQPSLFPELTADDLSAFTRTIDGHEETVVAGTWKQDKWSLARSVGTMGDNVRDPGCSRDNPSEHITDLPLANGSSEAAGTLMTTRYRTDRSVASITKRVYDWADGRAMTVWVTRTDGTEPSNDDLMKLYQAQLDQLREKK